MNWQHFRKKNISNKQQNYYRYMKLCTADEFLHILREPERNNEVINYSYELCRRYTRHENIL